MTCFGRAWPSSGHKLLTINNSEEETYTYVYLDVLRIRGVQRDLVVNRIMLCMCNWFKLYKYVKSVLN